MSVLETFAGTPSATSSLESVSGHELYDELVGGIPGRRGPPAALASPSPSQARKRASKTPVTSGPTYKSSSASVDLQSSLESKLRARLQNLGSTLYTLTWKPWTTPSGVSRSRLRASVPRTSGTGSTGWPTPTASDSRGLPGYRQDGSPKPELTAVAELAGWGTPTAAEAGGTPEQFLARKLALGGKCGVSLTALNLQVQLTGWATPSARDWKSASATPEFLAGRLEHTRGKPLSEQAFTLAGWPTPTPTATDPLRCPSDDFTTKNITLNHAAVWAKHHQQAVRLTDSGEVLTGSSAEMASGGQLNPEHSRWLMGLPAEWCACAPTETRSTRKPRRNSSAPTSIPDRDPLV